MGVLGLTAGLFLGPDDLVFPLLFVAGLVGLTLITTAWSKPEENTVLARSRRNAVIAGTVISGILACAGCVVLLGAAGLGLPVVLGVTSPAAMRWCGRKLGRIPGRRDGGGALTTAELCKHWQDSYEALRVATTAAARLRIVETRQLYLDELERRDPIGLKAWLGENASAAGDPSRFLVRDGEDFPPAD
ncbi:hypothetical protein [Streptomyces sp. SID13031]|uniref:hypothetical protein n=1 Tax=Streptomyces sp. SID13031 TaxID=2706046 RepID=UPI0013CBA796|nr:hypothetical protein [Streptomyces sp. SID13031]NEA30740.1 hypothetical protein [Streptomyces sp. SID13031]